MSRSGRALEILRTEGLPSLGSRAVRRLFRKIYDERVMIYVERTLQDLAPRYEARGGIVLRELFRENARPGASPLRAEVLPVLLETLQEGCRVFIGLNKDQLVGWMVVGKSWRRIYRMFRYDVSPGEKELVAFDLFVLPEFRKGPAAGALEEKVFLTLKREGYEKVFGAIDVRNRPSLTLAWHLGFKEAKRVRLRRVLFVTRQRDLDPVPTSPFPLKRPDKVPPVINKP